MTGLVEAASRNRELAKSGLRDAMRRETQRNRTNDQIATAEESEKKSTIGTGAGMGLQYDLTKGSLKDVFSSGGESTVTTAGETVAADSVAASGAEAGVATAGETVAVDGAVAAGAEAGVATAGEAVVADAVAVESAALIAAETGATTVAGGVATGTEAGATMGPWGALIGAGIGLVASQFL